MFLNLHPFEHYIVDEVPNRRDMQSMQCFLMTHDLFRQLF